MNLPLPQKIANAPELQFGLKLFFEAFNHLDSTRFVSNVEGNIPWTAIKQYCDEYDIIGEQREDMFYFVRGMDNAYLRMRNRRNKNNGKA